MKEVKKPTTNRIAKTPLIMQLETLECGAASLAMVMAYYGKWVPLEQVREDAGISRDGSKAKNIILAAQKYGFTGKGYACDRKALMEYGRFPVIIHWNRAHFVVLCGFTKKKAIINDPGHGVMKVGFEEFDKRYSGIYLEIQPGEDFVPGGKRKSVLPFVKKRLAGATGLLVLFSIIFLAFYGIQAADPLLKEMFVNDVLSGNKPDFLRPFILIVAGIGLGTTLVTLLKQLVSYKVLGKLAIKSNTTFLWKVLRLPISFFSQRMAGDIEQRKDSNTSVAATIVNVFAPLLLNILMLIFYLVLMTERSLLLTLVGVISILIDSVISQILVRKRINIARVYARDAALLNATTAKGVQMIETIKSSGAEKGYFATWEKTKSSAAANKKKLNLINNTIGLLPSFLSLIIQLSILFLGVYLTMIGEFTIGSLMAVQGLLVAMLSPATAIINSGEQIQEMRTSMERIDDVMEHDEDPNVTKVVEQEFYEKNVPNIEIRNLTFGYNRIAEPLIRDFSLSIPAGSSVALVGGSGSGKSTLAKLIAGLYAPWEGEILYDGKGILEIDRDVFSNMVSIVDQDIVLFEDTIKNNIKMWDDTIEDFEMILAARDASIHKEIMAKGGYLARVDEGGRNFSGGERQRIEIARALANDPSVLILDEATSALDAETEHDIVRAIKRRGVTTIVVAHRLSTVRDADIIMMLDQGIVVEHGTHEELMARKGRYYELVSAR